MEDKKFDKIQEPKLWGGVSYTGSEIINVHKTKEQREHNKTLFPNPNQNNNGSLSSTILFRYMKVYSGAIHAI